MSEIHERIVDAIDDGSLRISSVGDEVTMSIAMWEDLIDRYRAALRSDSPVSARITSRERPPLVIEDEPASTGGERDEAIRDLKKALRSREELARDIDAIRDEVRRLATLEGAVPVKVRYGRKGGFDILPNDLPKRWIRDNTDEWIPAWLVPRNRDGGDDGE